MMRRSIAAVAAAAAITTAAHGQDQAAVIAKLRADLAAARETIARARATIAQLEARVDAIEVAPAPLARAERRASGHDEESPPLDFTDAGEVDATPTIARTGVAKTSITPQTDSAWEYGPPGPIGLPLSPPSDEYAAGVELVAGSGSGVAIFSITHSDDKPGKVLPDGSTEVINNTLTLNASAPLSKDGTTPFATLDGLVTGTKISFGFTQFAGRVPSQESDGRDAILVSARARCVEASPAYEPGCVRLDDAFLARFMSPDERRRYETDYAKASIRQGIAWSLRTALGYDDFSFYAQPTLTKKTVDRLGWSVGGALAAYPARGLATVVALDYQRSFKASEAVSTCPVPILGQTTISCVPGPIDGPKRTDKLLLAPELRFLIPTSENGLIRSVGLGPRVEIDLLASELAFDLPIYLASDPKSGLTGGLRAGYVTKGDDFRLGIFVGKTFSLFK